MDTNGLREQIADPTPVDGDSKQETARHTRLVSSFDVFDTVLTRRVGAPSAVADLLGARLQARDSSFVSAPVFANARRSVEANVNDTLGRHGSLAEIYERMAEVLNVPQTVAARWAAEEEALERELVVPLPGASQRVSAARAASHAVIFVSDTPHRVDLIEELLDRAGLLRPGDRVFVSGGGPYSKSRGGLFTAVEQDFGSGYRFHHVGDDAWSDVAAARREGWSYQRDTRGRLTRYEEALEERSVTTQSLSSWMAGASRQARLEAVDRGVSPAIAGVASGVLAPMLTAFALWIIGQARQHGVERLYFVLRDGEVMLRAAEPLVKRLAPDLELRYLYGSRQAWILGATATSDVLFEEWVRLRREVTLRTALSRFGLTPEAAQDLTSDALVDAVHADDPLSEGDRGRLMSMARRGPLREEIRRRGEIAATAAIGYLRQEKLLDGTPSALVDAGWRGYSSAALDELVRREHGEAPVHLMIGCMPSAPDLREHGLHMVPWLFDRQRRPRDLTDVERPNVLIEMLCAGSEGKCVGYRRVGDRFEPVLENPLNEPVVEWGLPNVQRTAVRAVELTAAQLESSATHVDLRTPVSNLMTLFWSKPSPAEATTWGAFPWEEETWPPFAPVAQPFRLTDAVTRLYRYESGLRRYFSWRAASIALSDQPWRGLLKAQSVQRRQGARAKRRWRRLRREAAIRSALRKNTRPPT